MELYSYTINVKKLKGQPFVIAPLGDIQDNGHTEDIADRLLRERVAVGNALGAWFIGMGDYTDFTSPSNRARLAAADLYDNAVQVQEDAAIHLVDHVYEEYLKSTKGRWLGLLEGHHFYQTRAGETTDQMLARKLAAPFLGSSCYIQIRFVFPSEHIGELLIWAAHGSGSGVSAAAPVQKLERLAGQFMADIYLHGHMTKLAKAKKPLVFPVFPEGKNPSTPPVLIHKDRLLIGTGGFSKAYVEGSRQGNIPRGGYVERATMLPVALGSPIIRVWPKLRQVRVGGNRTTKIFIPEITEES